MTGTELSNALTEDLNTLARACRIVAMEGHGDVTLGHLSLRDPEGRGLWMKRFYVGLDEIMGPDDFVLLDFDGNKLSGKGAPHSEWPIHTEIMRARDDVNVVGHTHPFYASLFAATEQDLLPIGQEGIHFAGNAPHYRATSDLVVTPAMGADVAASLGDAWAVFMKNHGVSFCGTSIAHATIMGIYLEKACRAQITLNASGIPWSHPEPEEAQGKVATLARYSLWENFFSYYDRKLRRQDGEFAEAERQRVETFKQRRG